MVTNWHDVDWCSYFRMFGIIPRSRSQRSKDKRDILNMFNAFDIETSTIWLNPDHSEYDVHSFMYSWAMQIEDKTITGREWDDFFDFLDCLRNALEAFRKETHLRDKPKLIIWVHNLQYEFAFLSGLYKFADDECFFRDVRKPIYVRMMDVFEFRCSYIQTNLSLEVLTKQMGVPEKLSGQKYDYSKIRFPWTPLTDYEQEYIITDVQSLVMAMKKRVAMYGDNLLTVPLTSTGYVRRDCKKALKDDFLDIREMKPEEREYRLLRRCFRGGNTHGNARLAGKIVENVYSYDIVSCYPTQQLTQRFPMKPFKWLDYNKSLERVFTFIGLGYAVVGLYQFKGLRLKKKNTPVPYISLGRCEALGWKLDNGRILECDYCEIALTEIDLEIVLNQYTFDEMDVIEVMVAQKDYLPEEYRKVIQDYYNNKTKLKGADTEEEQYMYMKSKNALNSVYGMSATDPIHQEILYAGGRYKRSSYQTMSKEEIEKCLKTTPFPYSWGCYTTALSRQLLQRAIDLACKQLGPENFVYCDTDSIKVIGELNLNKLNGEQIRRATNAGAFADDNKGRRHYIGVFEEDGHYDRFIFQHAKCYAYEADGHLGITVSGVTKKRNEKTGEYFAVEELGELENFQPGMIWEKAGGTMSVYNDDDDFDYTDPATGKTIHIGKNVSLVNSTYKMAHSRDYELLLKEIKLYGEYKSERE